MPNSDPRERFVYSQTHDGFLYKCLYILTGYPLFICFESSLYNAYQNLCQSKIIKSHILDGSPCPNIFFLENKENHVSLNVFKKIPQITAHNQRSPCGFFFIS